MPTYPILGLVGPSGSGKTSLIEAMLVKFPDQVAILKSLTTRPRRGPEDDINYDFISQTEIKEREAANQLIQISEYAGNFYSNDRIYTDDLLSKKIGICALVEQGVRNFRSAGYTVIVIRVIPKNFPGARTEFRELADRKRAKDALDADLIIENDFSPGGLETAKSELANSIQAILAGK